MWCQVSKPHHYDTNGNIISDDNKNIRSIEFNILNLPETITYSDGREIVFMYTSVGEKLAQKVYDASGQLIQNRNYITDVVYDQENLQFLVFQEGYAEPKNSESFLYTYQYKDHLGNIRLSFIDYDANGQVSPFEEIKEVKDYYPFGLQLQQPNTIIRGRKHHYGYNGKEHNETFDLNWYDYMLRQYDSSMARFVNIDPASETYYSISPYSYVANNPLNFIDPTGALIEDPHKMVTQYKNELSQRISNLKNFIKKDYINKKTGNQLINDYKSMLKDIERLEKADQIYVVSRSGKNQEGGVHYDATSDKIIVNVGSTNLITHELEHAVQFEKGQVSFMKDNSRYGVLYDITDETKAYNQERIVADGKDFYDQNKAFSDTDTKKLGKALKPPAYQNLPSHSIDLKSPQGRALIKRTIEAGKKGLQVKEVFKGWRQYYRLGQKSRQ
ncbi:RHS repeat domain-containing protein [Aquimarina sp. 2304DJ70-9]|uniref:RHS repeat domain-containing protein n=1 Tax=Aquimarina penaris TaxID=3231044 RepID=UPI003461A1EE